LLSSIVFASNDRWLEVKSSEKGIISLDTQTISIGKIDKNNSKILACWVKISGISDKTKNSIQDQLRIKYPKRIVNLSNVSEIYWKFNFDVNNDELKEEAAVYYNEDRKELFRETMKSKWYPIEPDSLDEKIYNLAKKQLGL